MMATNNDAAAIADRSIVTTRVLDAPRELVFAAWTDPAHIGEWWGPDGFTTTTHEMDVRAGGAWRFIMHGPDGVDYPNLIVFTEIVPPERLAYDHSDGDGGNMFRSTVTFDDEGGKTRVTLRGTFATAAERDRVVAEHGAIEGAIQTLGRLAAYLAKA
jgi:uncharacterized protein YndB with AHSA1/START domain